MTVTHCTEAELVSFLDGEALDAGLTTHLQSCEACRIAMDELERRTEAFRQTLSTAGPSPAVSDYDEDFRLKIGLKVEGTPVVAMHPQRSRGLLRLAIAAGLAGLLLAPPVRAWVVGTFQALTQDDMATTPAVIPVEAYGSVSVRVAGSALRLVITGEPASVRVAASDQSASTLRVDGPADVVALSDGFDVSDALGRQVRLEIPASIETIEVFIDGALRWRGAVPRSLDNEPQLPLR